ncbi:efflux RND transporter periplasmic adaptor subunit [Devosia albogilva]|uniref:Efflux RND transporter periplasmic adaptor subunit n=1 Tax=Devosia albogilva TaxID=429726 RepID=A0ABW5QKB4_9HYPH
MATAPSDKPEWAKTRREREREALAAAGLTRRRRWPWILLVLVILAAVAAAVFFMGQGQQPAAPEAPAEEQPAETPTVMQLRQDEVLTVEPQRLENLVRITGSIAPVRQTQVSSEVNGQISEVLVRAGDRVEEGDVLVQVDISNLELQLNQARATAEATRAQLSTAENELARTQDLISRGLAPSSGLEQAQGTVNQLRASLVALEQQVAGAENALANATVTAPLTGIVSVRAVEPGQTVAAGTPLVTVVDLSSVEVVAAAPVGTAAQIERGQTVRITVEGLAGRTFEGEVDRINPVAQEGTRTIPVYVALDNTDGLLRGGMFVTGNIVVDAVEQAIAVPAAAIREDAEGPYVLKLEGEAVVRQPVEAGEVWSTNRLTEIRSGLVAGDVIVSAVLPQLVPGTQIQMLMERGR